MSAASPRSWDVIVVGAGPAGATAARRMAQHGLGVLLLEKSSHPRPKACGGGLTRKVRAHLDCDVSEAVESVVSSTRILFRGKHERSLTAASAAVEMVRRPCFDALLARRAVESGATLLEWAALHGLRRTNGRVEVETPRGSFRAPLVVGADGAASPTGRLSGLRANPRFGIALDVELVSRHPGAAGQETAAIFDLCVVPEGYAWSFPKRGILSIGVATARSKLSGIHDHLRRFRERHPELAGGEIIQRRGAPLPFWDERQPLGGEGVTLVGDAAGLVDPFSGEGIPHAIRSGAALAAFARDFVKGDQTALAGYDETIRREITEDFEYALRLSRFFFAHPRLAYFCGMRAPATAEHIAALVAGRTTYREIYRRARASLPGRTYRIARGWSRAWS